MKVCEFSELANQEIPDIFIRQATVCRWATKGSEKLKRKKCYTYTRVSTIAQVDGFSLEAQQSRIRQFAEYKELEIVGEYCDAGRSGHSIKGRPAFMEMMDDITSEKDDISFVLVFKLSRFGRNAADVLKSMQFLADYDVDLICVDDSIDSSTQGGRLTLAILSAVAEIERENINVQFMAGKMQKLMDGGWTGGPVPYGYRIADKKLVTEPQEAEIVRLIFTRYLQPDGQINAVVRWLNENGYRRTVKGVEQPFNFYFVSHILRNPIYSGRITYNRRTNSEKIRQNPKEVISVRGKHEALVSEEDWERAQKKRECFSGRNEKKDNPERISMLSGLVKCPACGNGMVVLKNKGVNKNHGGYYKILYYYGCRNHRKSEGRICDFRHTYNQEKLDAAVLEIISQVTGTHEFQEAFARAIGDRSSEEACEAELKALRKELHSQEHLKYKLGAVLDNLDVIDENYDREYESILAEMDTVYERMGQLQKQIENARVKLLSLKRGISSEDGIRKILDNFDRLFQRFDYEERREMCRQIIERIDVFPEEQPDGRILKSISFRFPVYFEIAAQEEKQSDVPDETVTFSVDCTKFQATVSESKATYAELKAYVMDKHGLNVSTLYISQIKRKYGIKVGKAYNKPENPKSRVPKCPKKKELAIMDALKNFRMLPQETEYFEEAEK